MPMFHRHDSITDDPVKVAGIAAISAALGAVVAMLFTPRNGNQVRHGLGRRAHHLKDEVTERFQTAEDDVTDMSKDTKRRVQSTATKVADDARTTADKVTRDTKAVNRQTTTTAKRATKPRAPRGE